MKFARKMVLVDYEKYNKTTNLRNEINVSPKPLFDLDKEMYEILQKNDLSDHDKHKLYISKLNKYLFFVNQQTKRHDAGKNEPLIDILKPKPSEPDNDIFSDKNTSNDEFFDISQSEEETRRKSLNKTFKKKVTSEFCSQSTPKKKKTKYMRKKTIPREGSPVKLRSSQPKKQLGGWFTFQDMIK
jgi:hypothetical protein